MEITINNTIKEIPDACTIQEMITLLGILPVGTAIAVNKSVIPKSIWSQTILVGSDTVTIIRATQGG
jgi:sulfur carrier protein